MSNPYAMPLPAFVSFPVQKAVATTGPNQDSNKSFFDKVAGLVTGQFRGL